MDHAVLTEARNQARPFAEPRDLEPLIECIADARIVMLGEATHGTEDFYYWRRIISEWLIVKHGFSFIAVEGDWPDLMPLHRHVTLGDGVDGREGGGARIALGALRRWPTWMWANTEVVRLGDWLATHNSPLPHDRRVGLFGLDVYSLFESMEWVVRYLEKADPFLARRTRDLYSCFERFHRDEMAYMRSLRSLPEGCTTEVTQALQGLLELRLKRGPNHSSEDEAELFDARQCARIVRNAESYYRSLVQGGEQSWNIRDQHMLDTLDLLLEHRGPGSKAIVWAHNSHIGDFRATDMAADGLVNLGGLARERHGEENVALVGFSTHSGRVVASRSWDGPMETMEMPPARGGSYEEILHVVAQEFPEQRFVLLFDRASRLGPLSSVLGHRAVGVVYDPRRERWGNYVPTSLAKRYDALLHIDRTRALDALVLPFDQHEIPETWPAGQ